MSGGGQFDAFGDSRRPASLGPSPPGWSSFQKPGPLPAAAVSSKNQGNMSAGVGRIATWSKWTYAARSLQTTLDPSQLQDGSPELGPKWSKVVRRITHDMHNGVVLDGLNLKGMKIKDRTGPDRNS